MAKKSNQKRADGRIAVQVYIGKVDGKRKYKTVYGSTQKEADAKAEELKILMNKGVDVRQDDSFGVWAKYYLMMKQNTVSDSQYQTIKPRVEVWQNAIGNMQISKIRTVDLQNFLNRISVCNPYTNRPTAQKTLNSYVQLVCNVFNYAIDNRAIEFNPAKRLKIPSSAQPKKERRSLTKEERKRVIEFEHRGKPAMMLMMLSGLRRGEATALLWSDIDFENSTISVTKSFDFKTNSLKSPKNGKSRTVTVPTMLTDYLRSLPKSSPLVFTTAKGKMMTVSAWNCLLESYLCDMNLKYGDFINPQNKFAPTKIPLAIEPFTYHCLRHTFCTIMYEAGVDVLTAQQQMGHSSPQITLDIYTHLEKEHKQKNLRRLEEYMKEIV